MRCWTKTQKKELIMGKGKLRKPRKRRKILWGTLAALAVVVVGGAGAVAYEYNRLQPQNHFQNMPSITAPKPSQHTTKPVELNVKPKAGEFNVLLMGSDARPGQKAGHSDSILLIHVDLNQHTYDVLSIPRDTRVYMPGYGYTKLTSVQYLDQVNHGVQQGTLDAVQAISQLTGVPINYYAETDYWGIQDMVNAVGGIEMDLPFDVTINHAWYPEDNGKTFTKGTHFLNGRMVTELIHTRYGLPGTDYGRQQLQEAALVGIAKAIMKPENVTKLPALSKSLSKFLIATNLSSTDMISLALGVKEDFHPSQQIHYRQVKGQGEVVYNDVLKAKDDEIILNQGELQRVVQKYFVG
ncbi:MAG: LCP family protein [Alicyclobacillus herbarius]|nr:LCP family protein [Alicyclobacillus herbarius]